MGKKDGSYRPNPIVKAIANIHMHQRLAFKRGGEDTLNYLKFFILFMGLGLLLTTFLGILMAFQSTKKKIIVWSWLLLGISLPILFIWMGK